MRLLILLALSASAWGCIRTGYITQPLAPDASDSYTFTGSPDCQPKVVLFLYDGQLTDGGAAGAAFGFGAVASSTQRVGGFSLSDNGTASSATDSLRSQTKAIVIVNSSSTVLASADIVTLDANGFTLNWDVADANARIYNYIAWGGADVTNVEVGSYTASGSPQTVTLAVAFQPDLIIFYFTAGTTNGWSQAIGMVTATDSWAVATSALDNTTNAVTKRLQRTGISLATMTSAGVLNTSCTTAILSNGFTQTCPTVGTPLVNYIAIKGGSYKLGNFLAPTSSGALAQTGVGFTPTGLLLASFGTTAFTTLQATARASWGAGTSSSARWSLWHGDTDTAATMIASSYMDRAKIFQTRTEAGASPTALASADLVSFGSGEFTLDWTADAIARQMLYLAINTSEAAGAVTAVPRRIIIQ